MTDDERKELLEELRDATDEAAAAAERLETVVRRLASMPDERVMTRFAAAVQNHPDVDTMDRFANAVGNCPDVDTMDRFARAVQDYPGDS